MQKLDLALKNCHGIRELEATFSFDRGNSVAIYAPNGTMKTSLARTLLDLSKGEPTTDHMFPARETTRSVTDESGAEIAADDVVVVLSYDEELGPSEATSTLLVNADLRKQYETIQVDLIAARERLEAALSEQTGLKHGIPAVVSQIFMQEDNKFFEALVRVSYEVEQLESAPFAEVPYGVIFAERVVAMLRTPALQAVLAQYVTRLNELLDQSAFFNRGSFDFHSAGKVTKGLSGSGFFEAQHTLLLHGDDEPRPIENLEELEALIEEEKGKITEDPALKKKLDAVEKALQRNVDTQRFFDYISAHEELLPELLNIDVFHQSVWKSYFKEHETLFQAAASCFKDTEVRRKEIQRKAASESTHWEKVIQIFNDRFFVPFRLSAENKHRVTLGEDTMLKLVFRFEDGSDSRGVDRDDLLRVLSNGEKKALYILNVLFEMEVRRAAGRETLFLIDDLADSFDYKNKYAIIQYLKEMADHTNFKLILLTHNFDFFRTLRSRQVVSYPHCFMAQKGKEGGIVLTQAKHINNPFINEFKGNFFSDGMQRIASIPFMRNILEYTKGTDDPDYLLLTSLLHWKSDSLSITQADLDRIFRETFSGFDDEAWHSPEQLVLALLLGEAEEATRADEGVNFENKIVLAIASRLLAETYMADQIKDPDYVNGITGHQTQALLRRFTSRGLGTDESRDTLDRVVLMTPENIHVNSFMYEPIIDMSDAALRGLFADIYALSPGLG